jgi:hypothetical protein
MPGSMTTLVYLDDIRTALGRPNEDANRVKRWINGALREIAYSFKFHAMEAVGSINTVNAQASYDLPADYRIMNGEPRIVTPQTRFSGIMSAETRVNYLRSARYPATSAYGRPDAYHLYASKIWVRPTPDATVMAVEFDYWKKVTPLNGDNDVSPLDEAWDDAIFRGAMYRGYLGHGEQDRAINMFNFFVGLVRTQVAEEDLEEFPEGGISYIQSQFDAQVR